MIINPAELRQLPALPSNYSSTSSHRRPTDGRSRSSGSRLGSFQSLKGSRHKNLGDSVLDLSGDVAKVEAKKGGEQMLESDSPASPSSVQITTTHDTLSVASGSPSTVPFRYHCRISLTDRLVMTLMIPILPLRILGIAGLLILGWVLSLITIFGIRNSSALAERPLSGWRRLCQHAMRAMTRWVFFVMGLHWIRLEGHVEELRGKNRLAPILVVAPHISYLDAFICGLLDCSVVARSDLKSIPLFGSVATVFQPIFVDREDSRSRISTVDVLKKRCKDETGRWPPIFIFPEGTTSNGKCLFKFKSGAFIPGQNVNLIGVRYRTCMRSFQPATMTWDTNLPVWKSALCLLLQPNITATVTAMGVYRPSDQEQRDPSLYTKNVQLFMSTQLKLPVADVSYRDAKSFASRGRMSSYRV